MDAVSTVAKLVEVALQIRELVVTVHQNKEDCKKIANRVERLRAIVVRLDETAVSGEETMIDALRELEETFLRSLKLVKACQTKNKVWLFITAGNVSKQLREVKDEIMEHMHIANFSNGVQQTVMFTEGNIQQPTRKPKDVAEEVEDADALCSFDFLGFRNFSSSELKAFTDNFSNQRMIGKGGSAIVYKGVLPTGAEVAIKSFCLSPWDDKNVARYGEVFSMLREHENVIRFLGYCHEVKIEMAIYEGKCVAAEKCDMFVVEEYMPNGNMRQIIEVGASLWSSAFHIIRGIARGVAHIHTKGVVHLDLKPDNILLDSEMNPKICDFERSKILNQEDQDAAGRVTQELAGTLGYLPPEYIADGILSFKHDVFSFGIILLQTVSKSGLRQDSTDWVRRAIAGRDDVDDLLRRSSLEESERKEIKRCMDIGLQCAAHDRTDRPTMMEVVGMLDGHEQPRKTPLRSKASSFKKKGK